MQNKNFYLLLTLFLFLFSCDKGEEPTPTLEEPEVSTVGVRDIGSNSALLEGNLLKLGEYSVIEHGFAFSKQPTPTINDNNMMLGATNTSGVFQGLIEDLDEETQYYVRAYAIYDVDKVQYGGIISFETTEIKEPNTWISKASYGGEHLFGAASFVIDDRLFVGTGLHDNHVKHFYEFDYQKNTWEKIASFPSDERVNAIGFTAGGYGYVGLGKNCIGAGVCTHVYYNDLWRYNPQNNSWTKMSDFPESPRSSFTCFVIEDKAYVSGGYLDNEKDLWEYNTSTDTWTQKADYPGASISAQTSFSLNNKGYLGLGWDDGANDDFWEYDPITDTWTQKGNFPGQARQAALDFTLSNEGYLVGGVNSDDFPAQYFTDMWKYNPENDTWIQIETNYPGKGRIQMISGIIGNKIIIGLGGNDGGFAPYDRFEDVWEYVPE
ncbi:MAG: Kelch repeat-containing protein [Chitinophagales bacterium]